MFVSLGYLMLAITRWIQYRWRHTMYRQLIKQVFRTSSVFIQKSSGTSQPSVGSLIRSPLLKGSLEFQERLLLGDDLMQMVAVEPQQTVQLTDWTSYYRPQGKYIADQSGEVMVLVEAARPADMEKFLKHEQEMAPVQRVHVLAHGAAVAWHSGSPFGIILHCSLEEFATLVMAFVDGSLTMDEDLEVNSIMTVQTSGHSASLFLEQEVDTDSLAEVTRSNEKQSETASVKDKTNTAGDKVDDHLAEDLAHTLAGQHNQQLNESWSNESLASNSIIGRVDILEGSDNDILDADDIMDGSFPESGSGEGLSEMVLEGSADSGSLSESWKIVRSNAVSKPPNVLIYTGKIDSVRNFEKTKKVFQRSLDPECYVIYHLKHEDIDTTPWIDNTALLVISTRKSYQDANSAFLKYFQNGGKIFGLGSGFDTVLIGHKQLRSATWVSEHFYKTWSNVPLITGRYAYNMEALAIDGVSVTKLGIDKDKNVSMVKVTQKTQGTGGCAVLSQILFHKDAVDFGVTPEIFNTLKKSNEARFEIMNQLLTTLGIECNTQSPPTLTPAVLLTRTEELKISFLKSIQNRLSAGVLKFGAQALKFTTEKDVPVKDSLLPVLTDNGESVCGNFNKSRYLENLQTRVLGNTVVYVDVVPTTMTLLEGLMFSIPKDTGLIAIARQQTSGKGRGGNSWLSPVGCAMFTLHVQLPVDSHLGRAMSYLQHITSLAVIQSVRNQPGYQDIDLRLKWPNDIYYSREMKLGGVIVKSTIMEGTVHGTIGCGFNVANSNPTICINDLIQLHNKQQDTSLQSCSTEQLIARTVTNIEALIDQFQTEGVESFRKLYYERWLHSDSLVTLQSEGNIEVKIVGLDEYGYLLVETSDGENISVQPDGNSFDMMQNLISLKTR